MKFRKGSKKYLSSRFLPGNVPHNKGIGVDKASPEVKPTYVRLSTEDYNLDTLTSAAQQPGTSSGTHQLQQPRVYLRPQRSTQPDTILSPLLDEYQLPSNPNSEDSCYRIYHRGRLLQLFNQAFRGHQKWSEDCPGDLTWDDAGAVKRGLAWQDKRVTTRSQLRRNDHLYAKQC